MVQGVLVDNQKETIWVPFSELLYIQTTENSHKLKVVALKNSYYIYSSLDKLEVEYPALIRCHRTTLVNPKAIKGIDKKKREVQFFENPKETCNISRRVYQNMRLFWLEYS
ncbi:MULTISPECIES: LytTR family DNA-binding domain-containing protein [unclassified Enterococcus]|uniref:LytTR family DNA-binding domain-containing protein n=1 Tax=unclassified Enterococcus TaxID=2608891 RepID=UPI001CE1B98F|nr:MULTISPECIES: LytTR family DNA-binding domain-containing protein [unclassified Enterococcus]MCA5013693.1 LytTR family transcriptional regulator DNA-binding domain-containing protein [Enterococcus sp. S23]MCA5016943.1 LytTR family transcriptional regulator DNA-binding domain-containing protein [Enterococcus sp. S22(2020)]